MASLLPLTVAFSVWMPASPALAAGVVEPPAATAAPIPVPPRATAKTAMAMILRECRMVSDSFYP